MVEDLIRQARRRFILNEAFAQSAFAAAVLAGGLILLLLLGTHYLSAWSLILFAVAGVGVGVYRMRQRTPDSYTTAVRLDNSAQLQDALSTAFHYSQHPGSVPPSAAQFQQMQREQAEAAARTVAVGVALPFTLPRAFYAMAALAVAASVLVGVRYRVGQGIDLQRPITEVLFEDQNAPRAKAVAKAKYSAPSEWSEEARDMLSKLGIKPDFDETAVGEADPLDKALEQMLQNGQTRASQKGSGSEKGGEQGKDAQKGADGNSSEPVDGGDKKGDEKGTASKDAKGGDDSSKETQGKPGDSDNGLLTKLLNAAQSMMAKSTPQAGDTPPKSDTQGGQKRDSTTKATGPGQGTPEKTSGDQDSDETDPDGAAMGGQKGKGNDTTPSKTPQGQEGSGIGRANGSKDIKAAEQLKAMGRSARSSASGRPRFPARRWWKCSPASSS